MKHDAWHTALGLAVQRLRRDQGVSQEQMALALQMSRSHASKLETGVISPRFETLLMVMKFLNVKPSGFMRQVEKEFSKLHRR